MKRLKRKIRILTILVVISNLVLLLIILVGLNWVKKEPDFDEITTKRINIVSEDRDSLRMVISNKSRQHPGAMNGKTLPKRERPAGMIFFNSEGDEVGGLIYDGNPKTAGLVLSVDQFKNDQIMQLQYQEIPFQKLRKYGLQLWDYPKEYSWEERTRRFEEIDKIQSQNEKEKAYQKMKADSMLMEDRLFIGKKFNKNVGLFINDGQGHPRIKIYIDSTDTPKIELLNKQGKIISDD